MADERFLNCGELIPGIPNEITVDVICPKLNWRDPHHLSLVSRAWQYATRNHLVYDARVRIPKTDSVTIDEHVHGHRTEEYGTRKLSLKMKFQNYFKAFCCKKQKYNYMDGFCFRSDRGDFCSRLPAIPGAPRGFGVPYKCHIAFVGDKLYVFGGIWKVFNGCASNRVFMLDLGSTKKIWNECARMTRSRIFFKETMQQEVFVEDGKEQKVFVRDGKVYMFVRSYGINGWNEPEIYNPATNSWSPWSGTVPRP